MTKKSLGQGIRSRFVRWLYRIMPPRARRMMFIISLVQLIRGPQALTDQTLSNVNDIMELGFSPESLRFPAGISHLVWRGVSAEALKRGLTPETYRELDQTAIHRITENLNAPDHDWRAYGSRQQMQEDLHKLLKNRAALGI